MPIEWLCEVHGAKTKINYALLWCATYHSFSAVCLLMYMVLHCKRHQSQHTLWPQEDMLSSLESFLGCNFVLFGKQLQRFRINLHYIFSSALQMDPAGSSKILVPVYCSIFNVCHPEVFNTYINVQWCISQTQQNFIMFIIVLGQHVSILESSSGPSKIQILTKILSKALYLRRVWRWFYRNRNMLP